MTCKTTFAKTIFATLFVIGAAFSIAACSNNPTPRGYANPGVPAIGSREALNAPYYTGADPAWRPRSGGGP